MATAVQGKVPAHKGPVNHEVESDDDVDDDDVRSLPNLLFGFDDAQTCEAGKGYHGTSTARPSALRAFCLLGTRASLGFRRAFFRKLLAQAQVLRESRVLGKGIRLVLFLTQAPPRTRVSPPKRLRDAGQGHDQVKEDHLLDLSRRPPTAVGKVREPPRPRLPPKTKRTGSSLALFSGPGRERDLFSRCARAPNFSFFCRQFFVIFFRA